MFDGHLLILAPLIFLLQNYSSAKGRKWFWISPADAIQGRPGQEIDPGNSLRRAISASASWYFLFCLERGQF
jgi:hypothetical protein